MSLTNINYSPKFITHLVAEKVLEENPLVVVDIGARAGFEKHWSLYGDQVSLIGFEADAEECKRLNREEGDSRRLFYPVALHRSKGKKPFYITAHASSSGFYKTNISFMQRLPDGDDHIVLRTEDLETVDFDSFIGENNINHVDFMKLDTEGSELDILQGSAAILGKSVIGLSVEVEFIQMHKEQPLFSDVDSFLRQLGFGLFDLELKRHSRKALPVLTSAPARDPVRRGQVIWGQALYFRDGVEEINSSAPLKDSWDDLKILKLVSLMELFCLPDCAIELIQAVQQYGLLQDRDIERLLDLLVPDEGGRVISYREYIDKLQGIRKRGYTSNIQWAKGFLPMPLRRPLKNLLVKLRDGIDKTLEQ